MSDYEADITVDADDIMGLRYVIGMGLVSFKRINSGRKQRAVRAACTALKQLGEISKELHDATGAEA